MRCLSGCDVSGLPQDKMRVAQGREFMTLTFFRETAFRPIRDFRSSNAFRGNSFLYICKMTFWGGKSWTLITLIKLISLYCYHL